MSSLPTYSSSCFEIIEVENILQNPGPGEKLLLLSKDIQRPCFRVRCEKLEAVKKSYNIKLRNQINLNKGDTLKLEIKIPIEIGKHEITSIPDAIDLKLIGYLNIEAAEKCVSINTGDKGGAATMVIKCGWVIIHFEFQIPDAANTDIDFTKICKMEYTLCFDKFDISNNSVSCDIDRNAKISYDNDICLHLKTAQTPP